MRCLVSQHEYLVQELPSNELLVITGACLRLLAVQHIKDALKYLHHLHRLRGVTRGGVRGDR